MTALSGIDEIDVVRLTNRIQEELLPGRQRPERLIQLLRRAARHLESESELVRDNDQLADEVAELKRRNRELNIVIGELEGDEESLPQASTYDRLDGTDMTIGGAPVRWEILQSAEPRDRRLRRMTIWMEDDDFQEHVDFEPGGEA